MCTCEKSFYCSQKTTCGIHNVNSQKSEEIAKASENQEIQNCWVYHFKYLNFVEEFFSSNSVFVCVYTMDIFK